VVEDAVAYITSLAELRGRNAEWAEKAVREAASLSSSAAARENVIDFVAESIEDVLAQADGLRVSAGGIEIVLETRESPSSMSSRTGASGCSAPSPIPMSRLS
jgi:membrane-bound serine protease (ClpP class)